MSNALNLLSAYDSDSDEENTPQTKTPKRSIECDDYDEPYKIMKCSERLPLPSMFETVEAPEDESDKHNGRIRTFKHERGNWSTYVYIAYEHNYVMESLINLLIRECTVTLQPPDDLHVSLTRTVVLQHHWIDSFVKTVTENVQYIGSFVLLFDNLHVYCNEERTRTFVGLRIQTGHDTLVTIVEALDRSLQDFNLQKFYKNPSFHMSIAWVVGDHEAEIRQQLARLNKITTEYISSHPQYYWYIHVKKLICKTGNKRFNINLTPVQ